MLAPPINVREFLQLLHRCTPPRSLAGPLAVANSGGPDSMCLLYLLSQAVKQFGSDGGLPTKIYSFHVDHGLQAVNEDMKRRVSALCQTLDVVDIQTTIPWGIPPFPPRPSSGTAIEETARDARSHIFWENFRRYGVDNIAFGHHADDQVETVLMRLMHGSGELGTAGMRRLRRWGMGSAHNSELGYAGIGGLYKWILRPFLEIPKSRILATCEANNIDYVTDPTNFQPDLTYRNYIRAHLSARDNLLPQEEANTMECTTPVVLLPAFSPPHHETARVSHAASPLDHAIHKLQGISGTNDLYEAVRRTNEAQCRIDNLVDNLLDKQPGCIRNSRFLFDYSVYKDVIDPTLRTAFVRRILQYVSPNPWGSTTAEAHGSKASLERIVDNIWNRNVPALERRPFSAGGKVLWTPVIIHRDGRFSIPFYSRSKTSFQDSDIQGPGWIAHRAPPSSREKERIVSLIPGRLLLNNSKTFSHGWDNRFNISFDLEKFKTALSPITIEPDSYIEIGPNTQWCLPRATLHNGEEEILLFSWRQLIGGGGKYGTIHFRMNYPGIACIGSRKSYSMAR